MEYNINGILEKFALKGSLVSSEPYGEGHINSTFLIVMQDGAKQIKYILQRINHDVFKNVERLMNNIKLVTEFARKKIIERGGDPDRETLTVINTKDDNTYYFDGQNYFRVYLFIDDAITYQVIEKPQDFYQTALAFGDFANLLAEFDASLLFESIAKFHDTENRFENLLKSIDNNFSNRKHLVEKEIEFALARKDRATQLVKLLKSKEIPLKVTHNDTKLNNILFDKATNKPVAVIDLDTIMPGSICYDFGDAIRFGCNPVAEDEKDLSKVNFDINLFEQFVKGYVFALKDSITKSEVDALALGAYTMTYECGIRFLTDYLDGDKYFRIHREGQNLDRCRTQFKLVQDMEEQFDKMNEIVQKYYNEYKN